MKLPNPDRAVVEMEKLSGYCLDPAHPSGRHKARVFLSALGITSVQAGFLRDALLVTAMNHECRERTRSRFGVLYEIEFACEYQGRCATLCSSWIIRTGEDFARLTSCYVVS